MGYSISTSLKPNHLFIHFNGAYHSDEKEGLLWYLNKYKPNLKILIKQISFWLFQKK